MNTIENIKEYYNQVQSENADAVLSEVRRKAFDEFNRLGVPVKHEEWKYTRISSVFNHDFRFGFNGLRASVSAEDFAALRLPGSQEANELVFINGVFSKSFSKIVSAELVVLPLEAAADGEFKTIVADNLGHSGKYLNDGINALNTSFIKGGLFVHVKKGKLTEHPIYIYNIADARVENVLAQPRSLVHVGHNAEVQIVETYITLGKGESFTNQVMEVVVEQDARLEYYKIQNDASHTNQVSTTHIRQVGKSFVHTVTISLDGNIVRNNQNMVMDAEYCEAHLYGLYFLQGKTHVDNHTVVDNVQPHCFSNELYKGIMNDTSTGVFNGKIFVQRPAQKTNAYQSNKNILLTDTASVNTKPQLEIFADDVKCSHGCTIGKLDEEGMFYLRSRGIAEEMARSLLLQAFSIDILQQIKLAPIRSYVDQLLKNRLQFDVV